MNLMTHGYALNQPKCCLPESESKKFTCYSHALKYKINFFQMFFKQKYNQMQNVQKIQNQHGN